MLSNHKKIVIQNCVDELKGTINLKSVNKRPRMTDLTRNRHYGFDTVENRPLRILVSGALCFSCKVILNATFKILILNFFIF